MSLRGQGSSSKAGRWRRAFIRKELICTGCGESSSAVVMSLLLARSSRRRRNEHSQPFAGRFTLSLQGCGL